MYVALELAPMSLRIVLHLAVAPMPYATEEKLSSSILAAPGTGCTLRLPGSCPGAVSRACGLAELEFRSAGWSTPLVPGGVRVRCRLYNACGLSILLALLFCAADAAAKGATPVRSGTGKGGGSGSGCGGLVDVIREGAREAPVLLAGVSLPSKAAERLPSPACSPSSCSVTV